MARDQRNNILAYDGTGDLAWHHRMFDQFLKDNSLGAVVADDDDDAVPARPDDAFARIANEGANQADFTAISYFQKDMGKFKERCEKVKGLYLRSFSVQSIRDHLMINVPEAYENATKANLLILRDVVIQRYGGWTDDDGKLNFNCMNNIPQFDSIEAVESGLFKLANLRRQRDGWGIAEQVYGPAFYRTWLKDHIYGVERYKLIHARLEVEPDFTYQNAIAMVQRLVDIDRKQKVLESQKQRQKQPEGFTFSDNTVTIDADEYQAMQPQMKTGGPCHICGVSGHWARECPQMQNQRHGQYTRHQLYQPRQQMQRQPFSQQQVQPNTGNAAYEAALLHLSGQQELPRTDKE